MDLQISNLKGITQRLKIYESVSVFQEVRLETKIQSRE